MGRLAQFARVPLCLVRGATGECLPKSNQGWSDPISNETTTAYRDSDRPAPAKSPIDRRAIPPAASEGLWSLEDGHRVRRIDWPGARADETRGSILFLPGRGDHYEKYLESLEEWHRAGWRVTATDWRGQGASGRLGKDAVTGHIEDYAIWIDDLAFLWARWIVDTPGPHILIAHSMGGHLALRGLVEKRLMPDAAVLSAPMLGFQTPPLPLAMLHGLARMMSMLGDPMRQAWKWSEKPGEIPAGREMLLTHDPDRYADEQWWRETRPELVMGPASWRWVERAYESMRRLEAEGSMEGVETPILILSTTIDKLVSHSAILRAHERLPNSELFEFGAEAHHEILREVDDVRDRAMAKVAEFLDRVAPA